MKTTLLKLKYFLFAGIAILALSCNPEDGADGLDGAPGIQGEQGPAGQDGENGTDGTNGQDGADGQDGSDGADGQDGNANVDASPWFASGSWENSGTPSAYFDRNAPEITQEIMDSGVVLAWTKLAGDSNFVRPLPATTLSRFFWNFFITEPGNIRFTVLTLDGSSISPSGSNEYRYVIIPASTTGKSRQPDFSKMSYEEVMDYLKLDY